MAKRMSYNRSLLGKWAILSVELLEQTLVETDLDPDEEQLIRCVKIEIEKLWDDLLK